MPEPLDPNQPLSLSAEFDLQDSSSTSNSDSLAEGFLKGVDPDHLSIVEPYVKDWDAGVTRRFQSIHDTYKPYKEFGDIEQVQAAVQLAQWFNDDPVGTIQNAIKVFKENGIDFDMSELFGNQGGAPEVEPTNAPANAPVSTDGGETFTVSKEDWERTQQLLQTFGQDLVQRRQSDEAAQQRKQFDNYLDGLETEHGKFDRDWVTMQMAQNGMTAEDAIKRWNNTIESYANSQRGNPAPNIFGGGAPSGQVQDVDVSKMTPEQRRAYVAARVAAG